MGSPDSGADQKEVTAMDENTDDKWLTRQDLADRYGLPVKTRPSGHPREPARGTPSSVGMFGTG